MRRRNVHQIKNQQSNQELSIILLSAGEATRMKSHGPRALLHITPKETLLAYQTRILNNCFPRAQIIVVCGYQADRVMNYTPDSVISVHNELYTNSNVSRSLALGLRAATHDNVLVIYGDLVFNAACIENISLHTSSLVVDKSSFWDSKDQVGCTINEHGIVEHVLYDLEHKWAQIAYYQKQEASILRKLLWDRSRDMWFGFETLNSIIEHDGKFTIQTPKNMKIIDIDSAKDLSLVSDIL